MSPINMPYNIIYSELRVKFDDGLIVRIESVVKDVIKNTFFQDNR